MSGQVLAGYLVPPSPLPLLAAERNPGWASLRRSLQTAGQQIAALEPDLLLLYSTRWVSIIGHQMQADPEPEWWVVDEDFHEFGSLHYKLRIDAEFAAVHRDCAQARGLHARTISYHGFPVDVGTISALRLLDPDRRIPAGVVSCNMYADRGETLVLGKATRDAIEQSGRRAVLVAVSALSNRVHTHWIDPAEDRIHSPKDDDWNRKILELLAEGRLEDVSQLARDFAAQANGDSRMKALWWLAAAMGQSNHYRGQVLDYQALWGSGGAVVGLQPAGDASGGLEYDEDQSEVFLGDREVLARSETDDE